MKLTLPERFETMRLLPEQGNFATLKIIEIMKLHLAPSEEEYKELEIRQTSEQIVWNSEKGAVAVDIELGEKATDIVVEALKKLDESNTLTPSCISLYEKFVV